MKYRRDAVVFAFGNNELHYFAVCLTPLCGLYHRNSTELSPYRRVNQSIRRVNKTNISINKKQEEYFVLEHIPNALIRNIVIT